MQSDAAGLLFEFNLGREARSARTADAKERDLDLTRGKTLIVFWTIQDITVFTRF